MKIAYVINSLEAGGAQFPIPELFRVLEDEGATVTLYALSRRNGLCIPELEEANTHWDCFEGHKKQHVKAALWLFQKLKNDKPNIIWTSLTQATLIGQLLGKLLGVPVVSWQHSAFLKPINAKLLKLSKSLSSLWVTDSKTVKDITTKRLSLPESQVMVWPLFYVSETLKRAQHWSAGDVIKIASLGRLHPAKGYDLLIKAILLLKSKGAVSPFEINIAGEGDERSILEALAKAKGVSEINFIGYVNDQTDFLSKHHAYIQPSRREGLGIAAHEAMQMGLPVLCSKTGQMQTTVSQGVSGWLCNTDDVDDLAKALSLLLKSPGQFAGMGAVAKQTVSNSFSQARFDQAGHAFVNQLKQIVQDNP